MKKILFLSFITFSFYISIAQEVWQKKIRFQYPGSNFGTCVKGIDNGYIFSGVCQDPTNLSIWGSYIAKVNESGDTVWTRRYNYIPGGVGNPFFKNLYDSSYILFDRTSCFNTCDGYDFFMMKLKLNGDTVWTKHYGSCYSDFIEEVVQAPNKGYYLYGNKVYGLEPFLGSMLIRLNSSGDTVWTRFINVGGHLSMGASFGKQYNFACTNSPDGGVIITGYTVDTTYYIGTTFHISPSSSFLIKVDSTGMIQWEKFIDNPYSNRISQIITTNNGYLCFGYADLGGTSGNGTFILKTDFVGNPVWSKIYLNNNVLVPDEQKTGLITSDGGIVFSAAKQRGSFVLGYLKNDILTFKTDSLGNLLWAKKQNINVDDVEPIKMIETRDKGFLIAATSDFYDTANSMHPAIYNGLLVKVDSLGNGCNDSTLTMGVIDFTSQIVTSDTVMPQVGFYPITVSHSPFTYGRGINYSTICSGNVGINEIKPDDEQLVIYPNPNDGEFFINLNKEYKNIDIQITNVIGQVVYTTHQKETSQLNITLNQPQGLYFVTVIADGSTGAPQVKEVMKIVKE